MPRLKAQHGALPAAVTFFLVHGELPPDGHPDRDPGLLTAFKLRYSPTLVDDLGALWSLHAAEILAATPAGATPWVIGVLWDPTILEDDEEAPET